MTKQPRDLRGRYKINPDRKQLISVRLSDTDLAKIKALTPKDRSLSDKLRIIVATYLKAVDKLSNK